MKLYLKLTQIEFAWLCLIKESVLGDDFGKSQHLDV